MRGDDALDEGHGNWHYLVVLSADEYAEVLACVLQSDLSTDVRVGLATKRALTEASKAAGRTVGGRSKPNMRMASIEDQMGEP